LVCMCGVSRLLVEFLHIREHSTHRKIETKAISQIDITGWTAGLQKLTDMEVIH
jgi:hypothetical protein